MIAARLSAPWSHGTDCTSIGRWPALARTQSVGESVYYYFKARDGTVQVVVSEAFRFGGPFMVTDINDY